MAIAVPSEVYGAINPEVHLEAQRMEMERDERIGRNP
jgi:hypothetical protein